MPRSTFYYRPDPRPAAADTALDEKTRAIVEAKPVAGLRMITARIRQ